MTTTTNGHRRNKKGNIPRRHRPEAKTKAVSYLPKDPVTGKILPGPGRTPGRQNRTTIEVKEVLSWAFDNMVDEDGHTGKDRFMAWCNEHPTIFYTQMYIKMLPMQIQSKVNMDVNINGEEARRNLEAAFIRVINAKRAGSEDPAVYVDGERVRDADPFLALPSPAGTDTTGVTEERETVAELVVPSGTRRGKD